MTEDGGINTVQWWKWGIEVGWRCEVDSSLRLLLFSIQQRRPCLWLRSAALTLNSKRTRSCKEQNAHTCSEKDVTELLTKKWQSCSDQLLYGKLPLEMFIPHTANQQGLIKHWAGWMKRLFKIEICNNYLIWYRWAKAVSVKEIHISITDSWEQVNKLVNKGELVDIIHIDMQKGFGQSP